MHELKSFEACKITLLKGKKKVSGTLLLFYQWKTGVKWLKK